MTAVQATAGGNPSAIWDRGDVVTHELRLDNMGANPIYLTTQTKASWQVTHLDAMPVKRCDQAYTV